MLLHLYIRDLAIVSQADIQFGPGMTVLTGETGAGKSILLDALSLALGERRETQIVRPGAEKAEICVTFDITRLPSAILWLSDLELTDNHQQQCIIRRLLYQNGRSKSFINGTPVTTQQLRLLAMHLVQIHGQHQHQLLLKPFEQLRILDTFGRHETLLSQVKTAYQDWEKIHQQIQTVTLQYQRHQSQSDLRQYQLQELESLAIKENELEMLDQEQIRLAHAQSSLEALNEAIQSLEGDSHSNAVTALTQASQILRPLLSKFPKLNNAIECLSAAQIHLEESLSELNQFIETLEINPERLQSVEQRLSLIHQCARKHRVQPNDLLAYYETLRRTQLEFDQQEAQLVKLEEALELAKKRYHTVAKQLGAQRQKSAQQLQKTITENIQSLGMPGAQFAVSIERSEHNQISINGTESVIFTLSANPGHPQQSLAKVASGGELSRVSLALELSVAHDSATPCMIFDEVDVGISGKTGSIVGKALYQLSKTAQVICVTHLPQVAAFGDQHIQVIKKLSGNNTLSEILILDQDARVEEVARMLGGLDVTSQAREHAKALLSSPQAQAI